MYCEINVFCVVLWAFEASKNLHNVRFIGLLSEG